MNRISYSFRPFRCLYVVTIVAIAFAYAGWTGVLIAAAASFDINVTWRKR